VQKLRETANEESAGVIVVSAQVEAEIMQLDKNERSMFLSDLGLSRSGLESLVSFESFESLRVALLMPNSD